jgi:hypothetical protein
MVLRMKHHIFAMLALLTTVAAAQDALRPGLAGGGCR